MSDLADAAKGTSLEAFLKMAEASDDEGVAVVDDEEDDTKLPEFDDDTGTGESYTPFGSVYGTSSEVRAVLDAAAGAPVSVPVDEVLVVEEAAATEPLSPSSGFARAQKSNTTRSGPRVFSNLCLARPYRGRALLCNRFCFAILAARCSCLQRCPTRM
jgi:hypothetical protein